MKKLLMFVIVAISITVLTINASAIYISSDTYKPLENPMPTEEKNNFGKIFYETESWKELLGFLKPYFNNPVLEIDYKEYKYYIVYQTYRTVSGTSYEYKNIIFSKESFTVEKNIANNYLELPEEKKSQLYIVSFNAGAGEVLYKSGMADTITIINNESYSAYKLLTTNMPISANITSDASYVIRNKYGDYGQTTPPVTEPPETIPPPAPVETLPPVELSPEIHEIIGGVGNAVTAAVGWISQFAKAITDNPAILICFVIAIAGVGITFLRRLFKTV